MHERGGTFWKEGRINSKVYRKVHVREGAYVHEEKVHMHTRENVHLKQSSKRGCISRNVQVKEGLQRRCIWDMHEKKVYVREGSERRCMLKKAHEEKVHMHKRENVHLKQSIKRGCISRNVEVKEGLQRRCIWDIHKIEDVYEEGSKRKCMLRKV